MGLGFIFFNKEPDTKSCNDATTKNIDGKYFEQAMKEIEEGYKDKGLEGKAFVLSEGDTEKAKVLYLKLRAEALQNNAQAQVLNAYNIENEEKHKRFMINLKTDLLWLLLASVVFMASIALGMQFDDDLDFRTFILIVPLVLSVAIATVGSEKYKRYALNKIDHKQLDI